MRTLQFSLIMIFHPVDAFQLIKQDRSRFSYWPVLLPLVLLVMVRMGYIYTVHYPLALLQPKDANMGLELVKILVPVLTWAIACYAVTTISDGESLLRETVMATAYCMLPYIIMMLPLAVLSHVLGQSEAGLYMGLHTLVWSWVFILFVMGVKVMNDYSLLKTLVVCGISITAMLLIWAALLLIFTLSKQLFHFVEGVLLELKMMYWE